MYVIDGIVRESGLTGLNPEDIQSMQILKDASSTAIYGSRGANGVVLITTKTGKANTRQVMLDAQIGIGTVAKRYDTLNPYEFATLYNTYRANTFSSDQLSAFQNGTAGTDWQDEIYKTGITQDYKLTFSGGSDKIQYLVSGNYVGQEGVVIENSNKRYQARANITSQVLDWLHVTADVNASHNVRKSGDFNAGKGNIINVSFDNGSAVFDKNRGLISYAKNGAEYLKSNPIDKANGFVPHIYRGRLDNDQYMVIFWKIIGLDCSHTRLVSCEVKSKDNIRYISTVYDFVTRGVFVLARANVDYCFDKNGKMTISTSLKKVCPLTAQLPRFGVHTELKKELEKVKYYGRGPIENYSDFKEHAPVGIYETTVTDMAHKYIKPQDSGNRGDVRYSVLTNETGTGLRFTALERYINFNANHFTLEQLKKAKHIEDLPDVDTTYVTVDGFVRGTGSGSCGPIPSKEHMIEFGYLKPLNFSFEVEAVENA